MGKSARWTVAIGRLGGVSVEGVVDRSSFARELGGAADCAVGWDTVTRGGLIGSTDGCYLADEDVCNSRG